MKSVVVVDSIVHCVHQVAALLAQGQLRTEQTALAEQGQHGSGRADAVFCRLLRPPWLGWTVELAGVEGGAGEDDRLD